MMTYDRMIKAGAVWVILSAGGLLAACTNDVTVLRDGSGSSGQGENTMTTGSTSGSGGSAGYAECKWAGECELVNRTCCGVCGPPALADMTAINRQHHDAYTGGLCVGPSGACDDCEQEPNVNLFAYCDSPTEAVGNCIAADVRESDLSRCEVDSDCRLRLGLGCCELCAGNGDALVAINTKLEQQLRDLVCPAFADIGCPECGPQYPADIFALCKQGHCAVDPSINGG